MDRTTWRAFWMLLLGVTLVSHVSRVESAFGEDEEGSGDDYGQEDDDDDDLYGGGSPVMPTRVVPSLRSPLPTGGGGEGSEQDKTDIPRVDSVYFEEDGGGSGLGEDDKYVTPSWRQRGGSSPQSSSSDLLSPTPSLNPGGNGGLTSSPSSPTIVTDRLSNSPPTLKRKLQKLPVVVGKSFKRLVPIDTFADEEDGGTRNLRLSLRWPNGTVVANRHSWVKFDERTQELRLLPVNENDVGRWSFHLIATDRQGQSVGDTLEIVVRQFPSSRLVNHYFELSLSFSSRSQAVIKNWEWRVLERLNRFLGGSPGGGLEHMLVRDVGWPDSSGGRRPTLQWTNTTLLHRQCPKEAIQALLRRLAGPNGDPTPQLAQAMSSLDVIVRSVKVHYLGSCLATVSRPPSTNRKPGGEEDDDDHLVLYDGNNKVPVIRNPLNSLNVTAGELLRFRVPEDTCFDREDGATPSLSLQLLTMNKRELSPRSWLQFDARNQEFIGIPLESDVGREEYQLVCSDHSGLSAIDGLEVVVYPRPFSERFGVEFWLHFSTGISRRRVELVEEVLPSYFGDQAGGGGHLIVVKSVDDGTLVYFNKTLLYAPCEDRRVNRIRARLVNPNPVRRQPTNQVGVDEEDSGFVQSPPHPSLARHLAAARFNVLEAGARLRGNCLNPPGGDRSGGGGGGGKGGMGDDDNDDDSGLFFFHGLIPSSEYLMTFLVPAVIIVCMLVLAVCLACLLHRKRKAGKLNLFYSEALPPRVPVILQDELYDQQDPQAAAGLMGPSAYQMPHRTMPQQLQQQEQQQPHSPLLGGPPHSQSLTRPTPVYRRQQR